MHCYKITRDGYILAVGEGYDGTEIPREEYDTILAAIQAKPEAAPGYDYLLKEDMSWELTERPEVEAPDEEISDTQALNIILGGESL